MREASPIILFMRIIGVFCLYIIYMDRQNMFILNESLKILQKGTMTMLKDYYVDWETLISQIAEHEDRLVGSIAVAFMDELQNGQKLRESVTPLKNAFFAPYTPEYPYIAELAVDRYSTENIIEILKDALRKADTSTSTETGEEIVSVNSLTFDVNFKIHMSDFIENRMSGVLMSIISDQDMEDWGNCAVISNEMRDRHAIVDIDDASKLIVRALPLRYIKRVDGDQSKASRTDVAIVIFVKKDNVRMSNLTTPAIVPDAVEDLNIQGDLLNRDVYNCFIVRMDENDALDTDELESIRQILDRYERQQRSIYRFCDDHHYPCYFAKI